MKIEIDLNDIIGDENGAETLQDSVRRQVIDSVTATIKKGVGRQIDEAVAATITAGIKEFLDGKMPELCATVMETEYTPVSNYGQRGVPTTFRAELVRVISENMQYKRSQYSSDKNAFTSAVDGVIEENMKLFKANFETLVNRQFTAEAMNYATNALKKKLGIA